MATIDLHSQISAQPSMFMSMFSGGNMGTNGLNNIIDSLERQYVLVIIFTYT